MKKMKIVTSIISILLVVGIVSSGIYFVNKKENGDENNNKHIVSKNKKDDWEYKGPIDDSEGFRGVINTLTGSSSQIMSSAPQMSMDSAVSMESAGNLGFSVGGAKDANNFRENIENGYFPISTDITYNGLFYDYTFDTGMKNESNELFSPSYSTAISKDPISNVEEYYMTVGLNSNIKESDFARKKLNLVIALDISGSMSSGLNSYYYDGPNGQKEKEEFKSKMEVANESVNILIDQLKEDDRFGMVLFDDSAYLAKPVNLISETDVEALKEHILEIESAGGTNFEAGYKEATKLFEEYKDVDSNEYENRIIVITDAMPNYGVTSKDSLMGYVNENAIDGIYTTFIGVGVDFNTKLIEEITNVKGANYYSVHTSKDFKERMGEQFEYMVTPLVFDLALNLESEDYEIVAVYGSDTVNKESGSIMKVNTLFPSKSVDGEVKGGVVLLKLNKKTENDDGKLKLTVSYKDRNGEEHSNSGEINFQDTNEEYYENTGIRKAILLTRYVNTLKNWILYERGEEPRFMILPVTGIMDCEFTPEEIYIMLGEHERASVELSVSNEYKDVFENLKAYIKLENEEIQDDTLEKEIEILEKLIALGDII